MGRQFLRFFESIAHTLPPDRGSLNKGTAVRKLGRHNAFQQHIDYQYPLTASRASTSLRSGMERMAPLRVVTM